MTASPADAPPPAVRTHALTKRYRGALRTITAVDELELTVPAGAAFGLLGPNGAGKTTTIQMMLGLVRPTSGRSQIFGGDIADHAVRRLVGFVPEKFQLPRAWTAREYVELHATLHGLRGRARRTAVTRVLERTGIAARQNDKLGTFSKGMQQRAAIAQALVGSPRLLILDEPTSALDPLGRLQVRELVRELHADGATIIFNSHILAEVEAICSEVAIMQAGRVVHTGPVGEIAGEHGVHVQLRVSGGTERELAELVATGPERARLMDVHTEDGAAGAGGTLGGELWLADEAQVGAIVRRIVNGGLDVLEVAPRREGLESLFVRLVGDDAGEQGAAGAADAGADAEVVA